MHHRKRVCTGLLIVLVASVGARVWAQEEEKEPPVVEVAEPNDPAVEAILATNPRTPAEWARAAKILADLDRPDLAKGLLKQVLDAQLDEQQLVALQESLGTAMFIEMASRTDLAPEAQQLSEAVLTAVNRHLRNPTRLAALIKQLQNPSADLRYEALTELRNARADAVGPLVAVLADPGRAAEHANVRTVLVALGADAVDPLIATLQAPESGIKVESIRVLAELDAEKAVVYLLAPYASDESDPQVRMAAETALVRSVGQTPSKQEAAELLAQRAEEYLELSQSLREDAEGRVELWSWDPAAKRPVKADYLAKDASLRIACRLAEEAREVVPDDEEIRLLHLAATLEQAAYENGLDKPLQATEGTPAGEVAKMGPAVVEDLLVYALDRGDAPVAAAAARILGEQGQAETLLLQGSQPAPLVRAASDADRRVRFAAMEAILELQPERPFPGSSRIVDALTFFAASRGAPRALVACVNTAEAQRVGGYLVGLGYELDTAVTGRDAIAQLLASPDYEMLLVDAAVERPTLDFLLQQLRHDSRTARLPVGVMARSGQLERAKQIVRHDPLAEAFSRPHTEEAVQWQVERLAALVGRDRILRAEREHQAARAIRWLADLSGQQKKLFDLSPAESVAIAALYVPGLGSDAITVLGNLGTPASQRALVDLASRWPQSIEVRTAAAGAFRHSVQHHGILLTTNEILQQYDRYNQSESLDAATQQVLGSILDSIEAPTWVERQKVEGSRDAENVNPADGNAA